MKIKGLIETDLINYKYPCMTIEMPYCSFKCDKECGERVCQNSALATAADIDTSIINLIERYLNNPVTMAIVFQGLEPFDSYEDLIDFIHTFRYEYKINDDIVIYTGYTHKELKEKGQDPAKWGYDNIVIKYGRFIPNHNSIYEPLLGVRLASDNQYARRYDKNGRVQTTTNNND